MTRLERLTRDMVDTKRGAAIYNDLITLRQGIPQLAPFTNREIETMYHEFSEDMYAAGWMMGPAVGDFRDWLMSEVG